MKYATWLIVLASVLAFGCDGQQYVNPDTVALVVTDTTQDVERVNHCHYIPVLLGSAVQARYAIPSGLQLTLTVTRDQVRVDYDEPGREYASYQIDTKQLEGAVSLSDEAAPEGYQVALSSPCMPEAP